MDNAGSDMRSRHVDLLTQQRRLRHLRSVALRNISARTPDDSVEASKLETFFSLYSIKTHQAFYTSEKIKGSLVSKGDLALATDLSKLVIPTSTSETKDFQCRQNPTWKSFNLGQLDEELVNTAGCSFIIRVFRGTVDKYNMVIEWMVNLFGLLYLGKKLQTDEGTYQPNTLIFALSDGFYGAPLKQDEPLVLDDVSKSLIKVDQASVRESYGTNSLSRIQTVLRAIKQTQASVKRVRSSIEDELSHSFTLTRKKREREMLMLRVNQMRSDLEWRTMQLQSEKENREQQQARNHQRDVQLRNKFDTLRKDKHRLHEKKKSYFDVREDLIKTGAQLVMRRKQLISELAHIYPINDLPSGEYTICCVRLPNSEDFSGHDEIMIAVALGYTCHLVEMISCFLDVPLRYRMEHRGSRSQIHDHILDKLTEKDRDFPLYSKGKERFQFSYGVYLLNKNIAQLRYYCGLGTTDLRLTLPNLKTLLELRLGVKFQSTNSLLSGHHVAIPPNFGGPQKYNTSFQSASQPVKSKNVSQHGTTDRDSSVGPGSSSGDSDRKEVSQFEQVLNQTKETHRNTEQINCSIEESAISNIPIQHPTKEALEEDIFKGSPDSFFGVESVENVAQRILELSEKKNRESTSEIEPGKLIGLVFEKGSKTEESKSATDTSSDLNSSPIGDPVPLNHKISGSLNHDTEVSSSVDEANYESKFKMWPTAKDHAAIPRTDSSDMLEDFPIERAVRKSVCEDDYENMNAESSTFKTYAMTHQKEDGEESMVQLNSSPQRCSVEEVFAEKKENSADVDKQNDSFNNSLATFSLANNKSVSVIEKNVDS